MSNEYSQEPVQQVGSELAAEAPSAHGWTIIREETQTDERKQDRTMYDSTVQNNTEQDKTVETAKIDAAEMQTTSSSSHQSPNMLYRHPTQKIVGGVCGGLADFLGWDPVLVRILWVVATIATSGGGFLAYAALWLLLPVGTASGGQERPAAIELTERNLRMGAYLLIGLGGLWLLSNVGILPWLWTGFWSTVGTLFWPALLIGAGFLLLNRNSGRHWRDSVRNATDSVRTKMNGSMPSGDEVKDGLRSAKRRIPLKRSRQDRMILGVCGGIGQKLGIDANLVRLIWAAFSIGSIGLGVLLYVAVGLLLPEESAGASHGQMHEAQDIDVVEGTVNKTTVQM